MNRVTVLFVAADPLSAPSIGSSPRLQLDEEYRRIREKVRAAEYRDALDFDLRTAARPDDLLQALNEKRPHVVHFSGHGQGEGIVLVGNEGRPHLVGPAALKQLFEVFRGSIRVVVLNACMTLPQAEAIAGTVGCAIGTRQRIGDDASITFAAAFYRALAFGHSVRAAFDQARAALALDHPGTEEIPEIVAGPGVDPSRIVLVRGRGPGAESHPEASPWVRQAAARRAGHRCSRCGALTRDPQQDPTPGIIAGVAARVASGIPGEPRFDPALTTEESEGAENAIWLCDACASFIDQDPGSYPLELLRAWKRSAEARAAAEAAPPGQPTMARGGPALVALSRLPVTRRQVFGREALLGALDSAWSGGTAQVVVISAPGGIGKTALVNRWLADLAPERYRGAERVFAWSFYSQGTGDPVAPADLFVETALRAFGDPDPLRGSAWDRGERLARLVRAGRTLLVLDGLEPLQHGPGEQEGRLKDRAVGALLVELAASSPGLCVVTTRLPVADLAVFEGATVREVALDGLAPEAGAELLLALGVLGTEPDELRDASRAFGGHPLALTLLGNYLVDACEGDARRWRELGPLLDEPRGGGHARRVLRAYARWFQGRAELSVLRLLGLFDRPADAEALRVLRSPPVIPGLTDTLPESGHAWNTALAALRRAALVAEPSAFDAGSVDAHPLVREYFGAEVRAAAPEAWREGNARLFDHLASTAPEFPDTLEEMAPLYSAVGHGREAGRAEEAIRDVYERRIQRGEEFFAVRALGSAALDLACLAGFFVSPWEQLVPGLPEDMQVRLLNRVGYYLRAVGRLAEAVDPTRAAAELRAKRGEWKDAVLNAATVAELNVLTGALARARTDAERCIAFAEHDENLLAAAVSRSTLGYVLHQLGDTARALELFAEAERKEVARGLRFHILYSLRGYQYADLLLDADRVDEACTRAHTMLGWAEERKSLLDQGFARLVLARGAVLRGDAAGGLSESREAMGLLQQADSIHHVTRAYIVRADACRGAGAHEDAEHFLSLARRHATRAGLRLHLIDCDAMSARLLLERGDVTSARPLLEAAASAAARCGYGRRAAELRLLKTLSGEPGTIHRSGRPHEARGHTGPGENGSPLVSG